MPTGTQKDYAKHRGVTQASVSKAIKAGRLSLSLIPHGKRFLIDFETADVEWAANSGVSENPAFGQSPLSPETIEPPQPIVDDDQESASEEPLNYAQARAKTEHFKAKTAEIDYRKRAGELVERSEIASVAFEVATTARNKSFARAPRLAQVALEAKDEKEAIAAVKQELRGIFEELADACERMGSSS